MHSPRPTPSLLDNLSIALAAAVLGLMAGFFWTYGFNVNRAMLQVDGATYATVQSLFNRHVRHAAFFTLFFGGAAFPLLALAVNRAHWRTPAFWMLVCATVVYALGVIVFTRQVNLPLNAYTESWSIVQPPADWAATREHWNAANMVRVWLAGLAFALALAALVLRASPPGAISATSRPGPPARLGR
ncbi:DUF1772 domain-containing protein [Comamonadaceae bacterium G21597-S1]|nr:DUF1772 domain-containing protein [Comamonadaceae bacterium G21597-S1]